MADEGVLAAPHDPVSRQSLGAAIPARPAYTWHDGTPRVVPIWIHRTGEEMLMAGPPDAPKVAAIREHPDVALTIDGTDWPYEVLLIRGTATVELADGVAPGFCPAARTHFGDEQGDARADHIAQVMAQTVWIAARPVWAKLLDFETRFPEALARRMGEGTGVASERGDP
jgi:hypothetical protein